MRAFFLAACLLLAGSVGGVAQTPPGSAGSPPPANPVEKPDTRGEVPGVTAPAPGQALVPEVATDPKAAIRPPGVDSKMVVPAPGSPGGDPSVNPK